MFILSSFLAIAHGGEIGKQNTFCVFGVCVRVRCEGNKM